jgi:hypothetical protein
VFMVEAIITRKVFTLVWGVFLHEQITRCYLFSATIYCYCGHDDIEHALFALKYIYIFPHKKKSCATW